MNIDDRDIVCQQDYTPLSNAELVEAIERYAAIMHTAPLIDFDLEWITGPARALAARVAELESQVAWRPGSENPPAPDWYQVGDIGVGVYDLWYSGEAWHRSSFQGATYRTPPMSTPDFWRFIPPLPPAPQETE